MSGFAELVPGAVSAAEIAVPQALFPLFPAEAASLHGAVTQRQIEFSAGRYCARMAMTSLGRLPCAVPKGSDRAPIWPQGLVGSITHGGGICAAVVAYEDRYRSIGIDVERVNAIPRALAGEILRQDEMCGAGGARFADYGADWPTLNFSLKEAAYKAFYPIYRRIIGFHDMRISVSTEARSFAAEPLGIAVDDATAFAGRYLIQRERIYAVCWNMA